MKIMVSTILIFILVWINQGVCSEVSSVIYIGDCVNISSAVVTNVFKTIRSTFIENNYPGTCLAYCIREGYNTSYIVLQGKMCLCGLDFTYKKEDQMIGCNDTCPGHKSHVCGSTKSDLYSTYIIDRGMNVSSFSCMFYNYTSKTIEEHGCAQSAGWICRRNSVTKCGDKYDYTWSDSVKDLRGYSLCLPYEVYNATNSQHRHINLVSNIAPPEACKLHLNQGSAMWISAFGAKAPKKNCPALESHILDNGNITHPYYNDNETISHTCNLGFRLAGDVERYCMANERWSGSTPSCNPEITVASVIQYPTTSTEPNVYTTKTKETISTAKTTSSSKDGHIGAIIGGIIGGVVVLIAVVIGGLCFWKKKNYKPKEGTRKGDKETGNRVDEYFGFDDKQAVEIQTGPASTKFSYKGHKNKISPLSAIEADPENCSNLDNDNDKTTLFPLPPIPATVNDQPLFVQLSEPSKENNDAIDEHQSSRHHKHKKKKKKSKKSKKKKKRREKDIEDNPGDTSKTGLDGNIGSPNPGPSESPTAVDN